MRSSSLASNTAAFISELPPIAIGTAAIDSAPVVRVQVTTPPDALKREGQKSLVAEATEIIADVRGDDSLIARTWVILIEAVDGGWGIAGTALGRVEFAALARAAGG